MNCTCLHDIDEKLKEKNLQLTGWALTSANYRSRFYITTGWIDRSKADKGRKNNPPYMFVSFCPFCGKPVEPEPPETPPAP